MKKKVLLCLAGLALTGLVASAQPAPKLTSVSSEWLQRGKTVEVTLNGEGLSGATGLVFGGDPGLTTLLGSGMKPAVTVEASAGGIAVAEARDEKKLTVSITVGEDAILSAREVRVVSPGGISNPLQLNVSPFRELKERSPNNSVEQAQKIELPGVVNGAISAAAEMDYYRFGAKKGQRLILDVNASRMGSALDSSLSILDAQGKELVHNEDANGFDSLIDFTVPEDGDYIAQIRDFRFQGGGNFKYRLVAGELPYLDTIFPFGAQRGKQVEIALIGRNLDGTSKLTLNIEPKAPRARQDIRTSTPKGVSNPIPFEVGDLAEFTECEPNNDTNQANAIQIPANVNGRADAPKDVDVFKFKSDKDQRLICEVMAQRFGSPLDALLILTDAGGKVLQQNDDADGADARIDFDKFAKDQEYFLTVRDLLERGGTIYGYRLTIRAPPEPDFAVRFSPDVTRLNREGRAAIRCEVVPRNGFNETVRVAFENLPPGVFAEPLLLSPGVPNSGIMILTAAKDAASGSFPVKLAGAAQLGGRTVMRNAEPQAGEKPVKEAFVTVLDAAPFTLEAVSLNAAVEQGQSSSLEAFIERRSGFMGEIKLSVEGFTTAKEGIAKSLDLKAVTVTNQTRVKLDLPAKLDAEVGTRTIVVKGEATADGRNYAQYSGTIPLTITQVPFTISSTFKRISVASLPPGSQSAAGETFFTVKADRRNFSGDIVLALEGVPEGVTATYDKIASGASEMTVKITASDKAPVGKEIALNVQGTGTANERIFRYKTGTVTLTVNPPPEADGTKVSEVKTETKDVKKETKGSK